MKPPIEKPSEAFVERTVPDSSGRAQRISIRVKDDGTIDWESVSDKTKEKFAATVANDPTALEMIGLAAGDDAVEVPEDPFAITEDHIKAGMEGYAFLERLFIPGYIYKKSGGRVRITPEISDQVFQFSEGQKNNLAPLGAAAANKNLPEFIRKWIVAAGPTSQFLGGMAYITWMQMKAAIQIAKANGQVVDAAPPNPATAAPPPPPPTPEPIATPDVAEWPTAGAHE